jgi:predicted RND superfamily exporter protein
VSAAKPSTVAKYLSALAGAAAGRNGDARRGRASTGFGRPLLVLTVAVVLGAGGAALALRLHPSAATDTFVGRSSASYRATQRFYSSFGEEPIDVMVQGSLQQLLLSSDIDRLLGLEGCLSGKVPTAGLAREGGPNGPCGQLDRLGSVKVVIGPGTFVNEAAEQIDQQLSVQGSRAEREAKQDEQAIRSAALAQGRSTAEARKLGEEASKITLERYAQELELLGAEYGLSAPPSLNDPSFVYTLVFDNAAKSPGTPKQRFAYLFPGREAALISVRMKAGLSEARRARTVALVRRALAMPQWRLQHGERYLLTGEPVIVSELAGSITHSIELLLVAVLLVMAVVLSLIFRGRPRLLPLGIAVLAAALTFGALAAVGAPLTVAQVAVLPVLIGLAVDYAIQFQSRVQEALADGVRDIRVAVQRAASAGGPTIAAAAAAGGGALLVMTLSPVPTVRGFALLLVVGIAIALFCALTAGSAVLALTGAAVSAAPREPRIAGWLAPSWRGAQELLRDNPLTRFVSRVALVYAVRNPGRVIGVGLALAALGWALDTQTHVQTNLEKLVPQNMTSLRNLDALERASGVGGEIDLMVSGRNLATPAAIEWMTSYQNAVLKRFGYTSTRGCGKALLCPAFSLPTLFQGGAIGTGAAPGAGSGAGAGRGQGAAGGGSGQGAAGGGSAKGGAGAKRAGHAASETTPTKLTPAAVNGLLRTIPPYFSQNVITPNRQVATLAFGIRLLPLDQQQHVIEAMRASLHPPRGVSAQLVGLPVLAAQSGAQVASPWRRLLTLLAGLAAAAVVLLAAFRGDRRRALMPLLPVLLATGWSALVVFAIRVPLNPMSVTLSALVIAISTEFSVLLSERMRQERIAGRSLSEALRLTYQRTGAAVAASGVTAIAGFGVLILSDINMLRDFGIVTLVDLSVSLLGVLVALPAALVLGESSPPARELARRGIGSRLPGRPRFAALRARRRTRHEPV